MLPITVSVAVTARLLRSVATRASPIMLVTATATTTAAAATTVAAATISRCVFCDVDARAFFRGDVAGPQSEYTQRDGYIYLVSSTCTPIYRRRFKSQSRDGYFFLLFVV